MHKTQWKVIHVAQKWFKCCKSLQKCLVLTTNQQLSYKNKMQLFVHMSSASHVLCQSISFDGISTNASNKRHAEVTKAASAFNMLTAYSTPDTNSIINNSFAFYPASVGVQCTLPVAKLFFHSHCLTVFTGSALCVVYKTRPVWNWKYSGSGHAMAAKTANCCYVNALFIHSVLIDRGLFSSCLYIKTWLISAALQYKVYFALQKCDFAAHFAMRCKTLDETYHKYSSCQWEETKMFSRFLSRSWSRSSGLNLLYLSLRSFSTGVFQSFASVPGVSNKLSEWVTEWLSDWLCDFSPWLAQ